METGKESIIHGQKMNLTFHKQQFIMKSDTNHDMLLKLSKTLKEKKSKMKLKHCKGFKIKAFIQ